MCPFRPAPVSGRLAGIRRQRGGARHPERRHRPGLRQAGRASACSLLRARAAQGHARRRFPGIRGGATWISTTLAPQLPDAATLWIADFVEIYEGGAASAESSRRGDPGVARVRPLVRNVRRGARARHRRRSLANSANIVWNQVLFDVLLEYPIRSGAIGFLDPARARASGRARGHRAALPAARRRDPRLRIQGDPGLVPLDPRWHQAALRFVELGFFHILDGTDHLLFLLCLVIPFRRFRPLVLVVTAFTVAHSITLIASAYDFAPGRALVSAADRNADRDVDRLHGAREHRRRELRRSAAG